MKRCHTCDHSGHTKNEDVRADLIQQADRLDPPVRVQTTDTIAVDSGAGTTGRPVTFLPPNDDAGECPRCHGTISTARRLADGSLYCSTCGWDSLPHADAIPTVREGSEPPAAAPVDNYSREAFVRICELAIEMRLDPSRTAADASHTASLACRDETWTEEDLRNKLGALRFVEARIDAEVAIVRQRAECLITAVNAASQPAERHAWAPDGNGLCSICGDARASSAHDQTSGRPAHANSARTVVRPGIAPGLSRMIPAIGRIEAARRVRAKITETDGVRCERLGLSDIPVRRGALFDMGGSRVPFPPGEPYESCYVALIDPQADAQWAHPAFWAFVPVAGDGEVIVQPTEFPEHALGAVRLRPEPRLSLSNAAEMDIHKAMTSEPRQ